MSFFGMGPMEIIVIMVVALIIFGPGKLPEIGAQAGKAMRDFRRATRDLTSEFEESVRDVRTTVDDVQETMSEVRRETKELAASIPAAVEGTEIGSRAASGKSVEATPQSATASQPESAATIVKPESTPEPVPAAVASRDNPFADLQGLDDEPGDGSR